MGWEYKMNFLNFFYLGAQIISWLCALSFFMVPRSLPELRHATCAASKKGKTAEKAASFSYFFSFLFVFLLSSFVLFLVFSFHHLSWPLIFSGRHGSNLSHKHAWAQLTSTFLIFLYSCSPMPSLPFYCTVPVASIRNGGALQKRAFPIPHSTAKSTSMPKQKPDQTSTIQSKRPQGGLQVSNASHMTWVILRSSYLVHSLSLSV